MIQSTHNRYDKLTWPGLNRVCCFGRCLFGPDVGIYCLHLCLIIVNAAIFDWAIAYQIHIAVLVGSVLLMTATLVVLAYATFTEAGIIPRAPPTTRPLETPPVQLQDGELKPLKWCTTCHIYRPPKSKHCRDCDCCVEEFDHHCPWVCNCIGKRNYRFFVGYLLLVSSFDIYILFWSSFLLISKSVANGSLVEVISSHPLAIVEIVISFLFAWCLCSLTGFHCFLIMNQTTTNEHVKQENQLISENVKQVEKKSSCKYFFHVFFQSTPPSLLFPRDGCSVSPCSSSSLHVSSHIIRSVPVNNSSIEMMTRGDGISSTQREVIYVNVNGAQTAKGHQIYYTSGEEEV